MAIPRIIHYCWFGGKKPASVEKYIEKWRELCPEYEIKEWNERDLEHLNNPFIKEAYEQKKWAYVSDYVRLVALTSEGGIYMDTDVEMIKPLDAFLDFHAVAGFEEKQYVMTGFLAAEPNHPVFLEWLKSYENKRFVNEDGTLNEITNVHDFTDILLGHGLRQDGTLQTVSNITIYPSEYFSPKDYYTERIYITPNTCMIHHFERSWCDKESAKAKFLRRHPRIKYLYYIPNRFGMVLLGNKYNELKRRLKK